MARSSTYDIETADKIYKYWSSTVTQEPVPDELKTLVKEDLEKAWHIIRLDEYRLRLRIFWDSVDSERILLDNMSCQFDLNRHRIQFLCNKPAAFYWLQTGQTIDGSGQRNGAPRTVVATIYNEWSRCYNHAPNIEFGHFFANPIRVAKSGPSTIGDNITAHHTLCERGELQFNQTKEQYRNNIDRCKFQNPTHFSLLNLYRSIIVIMDHFVSSFNHHGSIRHKTCIALEDYAQFQTVLITCTSLKEEELKAPISFESPKAHCLPLQRSDTHGFETVRVSLATAIRFITDLEKRENPELMKHTPRDPKLRLRTCTSTSPEFEGYIQDCPEAWAKACIEEAEIVGFDNIHQTWRSIRRVKAASNGETFWELAPELFRENWKEYSGQPWNYLEERLSNDNSNN